MQEQSVRVCRRFHCPNVIPRGLPPLIPGPRHALLWQAPKNESDSDNDNSNCNINNEYLVTYTDPNNWVMVTEDNIDSIEVPTIEKNPHKT